MWPITCSQPLWIQWDGTHYFLRDPVASLLKKVSTASEDIVRAVLPADSGLFRTAKNFYYQLGSRRP